VSWEQSRKWYKEQQPAVWEAEKARAAQVSASGDGGTSGAKVQTSLPCVTVLDFYFPPGSKARAFLEGLSCPPSSRFSSKSALAWLEAEWPSMFATLPPLA